MPENTLLPLDADTIRTAYDAVLWAPCLPTGEELDILKEQLQGHVQLLVPDVQDLAARMRGEMRRLAIHVVVRASQLLEEDADGAPACDAYDLATMTRALLTLHQQPGPLGEPTGADEIAEEIRRRLCGTCSEPSPTRSRTSGARSTATPATESTATRDRPPLLDPVPPQGLRL
ncbi:hypothetical protein J7F01_08680 [Streptomyces sp. ISL-22]|uniref:DUF6415 family natural product biosynthesis protein n=1 Tax=unclassified Streptomyces TaxID=2593676 RepID=UPI001BE63FBF|nr:MULTISPECIES: DUF6415 family natural product biosynthesis protein [unclassified Streptomyces]MBT2418048.1 hypothetical protein [Streptomyces sp. ISL-24]MBT2432277.1 hypothetical protein [Streptomyces sp. ISL-22]